MSQLILDGYNIMYKISHLRDHLNQGLEDARKVLANFMITWAKSHNYKGSISIVKAQNTNVRNKLIMSELNLAIGLFICKGQMKVKLNLFVINRL
jgi:predicted RNA-binding protein with PIN domain